MRHRLVAVALSFAGLATPAFAGPLIVTPPARTPAGGSVRCVIANASPTKSVEYTRTIYDFSGSAAASPVTITLSPNTNISTSAVPVTQGHCVVEVLKGGKRNVRVALHVQDSGGNVVAIVPGQ